MSTRTRFEKEVKGNSEMAYLQFGLNRVVSHTYWSSLTATYKNNWYPWLEMSIPQLKGAKILSFAPYKHFPVYDDFCPFLIML